MLRGRRRESAVLEGLLDGAHAERSGALVLWGYAGVGKRALLEYVIASPTITLLKGAVPASVTSSAQTTQPPRKTVLIGSHHASRRRGPVEGR
jgi:hypothetical protein